VNLIKKTWTAAGRSRVHLRVKTFLELPVLNQYVGHSLKRLDAIVHTLFVLVEGFNLELGLNGKPTDPKFPKVV
jgi:hypothetical protein